MERDKITDGAVLVGCTLILASFALGLAAGALLGRLLKG